MKAILVFLIGLFMINLQGCAMHPKSQRAIGRAGQLIPTTHYFLKNGQSRHATQLNHFVKMQLQSPQGIRSHNHRTKTSNDWLAESSGLWLLYLASLDHEQAFDAQYRRLCHYFERGGYFRYRLSQQHQLSSVNATVDDFRIIRALRIAALKTGRQRYQAMAKWHFQSLAKRVQVGHQFRDFYDAHTQQTASITSLAYYDLLTMRAFENRDASYRQQLSLVQKGYLSNDLPLYAANYNWRQRRYSTQPLNTSEALLTLLHLAEVGQLKLASLKWVQQRVSDHQLYNGYSVTGQVTTRTQSAGNYAIAARIFAVAHRPVDYQRAMKQVWQFQIRGHDQLTGALGDRQQHLSYAFNDLQALVATTY